MITLKNEIEDLTLEIRVDGDITNGFNNLKVKTIVSQGDKASIKVCPLLVKENFSSARSWFDQLGRYWNYFESNLWLLEEEISFHHLWSDETQTIISVFLGKQMKPEFDVNQVELQAHYAILNHQYVLKKIQDCTGGCFFYFSLHWEETYRIAESISEVSTKLSQSTLTKDDIDSHKIYEKIEDLNNQILSKRKQTHVEFFNRFNNLSLKITCYGYARNANDPQDLIDAIEQLSPPSDYNDIDDDQGHEEDDHWLDIGVEVIQGDHRFSSDFECMTAYDLLGVTEWFKALSENRLVESPELSFLERELSFHFLSIVENAVFIGVGLSSGFELDFLPKQFHPHYYDFSSFDEMIEFDDPYQFRKMPVFILSKEELARITKQLETIIADLPYPRVSE